MQFEFTGYGGKKTGKLESNHASTINQRTKALKKILKLMLQNRIVRRNNKGYIFR